MSPLPPPRPGEKLALRTIGPFSAADLADYAAASGDANLLHLDLAFARGFGFAARPVHGMKLLASFEPLLREWRPDLVTVGLSGHFLTPVLEEQTAVLGARVAKIEAAADGQAGGFVAILRLVAHTEAGAPALVGEARLAPAPAERA